METIRNYLETMFANLPNTQEILRAKNELWQMMEDKYNELKSEGKSENEAIGIVISEFGNLDEIAEDLGIRNVVQDTVDSTQRMITLQEAKDYLHDHAGWSFKLSLGIFLCIICPLGAILTEDLASIGPAIGITFLFACIAAAVALFIYTPLTMHKWSYIKEENCTIDFATTNYVRSQQDQYRSTYAFMLTTGIVLCVISFVPAAILDEMNLKVWWISHYNIDAVLLFLLVGIGVFMIVMTSHINSGYNKLLHLNDRNTVGGNYVPSKEGKVEYATPWAASVMSVYWTTVTCIYLIWSFLTFDWHFTWIIWPIAAVIHSVLNSAWRKDR